MTKLSSTIFRLPTYRLNLYFNNNCNLNFCIGYSTASAIEAEEPSEYSRSEEIAKIRTCFNPQTFSHLLNKCIIAKDVSGGKNIHAHIIKTAFSKDVFLLTTLINMYSKCGDLGNARQVFDKMPERDEVSWNAMISGYSQHGNGRKALNLFSQMHKGNMKASNFTFGSVLRSCASIPALEQGNQVHTYVLKLGFDSDAFVESNLVNMYAKCGNVEDARLVFDKMSERDVVSWNALIAGFSQNGRLKEALEVFSAMHKQNLLNHFPVSSALQACAGLGALGQGKQVHGQVIKMGLELGMFVASALVDMYAKCRIMEDAFRVFDVMPERDIVSWTAMIVGYAQNGYPAEALNLFCEMQEAGVEPNRFPLASVLSGCGSLEALEQGKQIHARILKVGFDSDIFVDNALVDMYAKCRRIDDAQKLFDRMSCRDGVSWSVMITGYSQNDQGEEALKRLHEMQWTNLKPDIFTFGSVLRACASLAALNKGQWVHGLIIKSNVNPNAVVGCALLDMYAKCGVIETAREVFDTWPKEDVASWNAMITAYAQHGYGKEAIQIFEEIQPLGIKPNEITFVSVLFACSHIGLVEKGRGFFNSMNPDYGITPGMEHYACMVDLLGRSGHLDEAEAFINSMPFEPNALVWKTLLSACRLHFNVDIGRRAADFVLKLKPEDHTAYILLSNIYAAANQWDYVANVRKMMRERGLKKEPGRSWIEMNRSVHAFITGDKSHPQTKEIYAMLETLHIQMKKVGYVPDTNDLLHDVQ